ncbi:valine--tRNA ligase [Candidatus Pacearchaeota archaeon]|nr:valine--tRNA ligase [Candidatus Pacearchaeota archaeon]
MKLKDIKNWGPDVEKSIVESWKKSEAYNFNKKSKKKVYSIDTPPPYVNAPIHIGQAVTYCYMDFFARYKRMKGFQVIFPLGLDRNGLPIEIAAEKEFGVSPFHVSRDEFITYCEKILERASNETEDTFAKFGISFTSYKKGGHIGAVYHTDSKEYRRLTQATFSDLFKKGLVYEDTRINNWDPKLQTTIADSEIDYKEIPSVFNFVKWKVKETGKEIIIATTRPELICTCGMVIFNPKDKRYRNLDGKTAITPIFGKEVKIKANSLASQEKGTGIAMMCSAGDLSDIQFFREIGIKPVIAINANGTMNENAGILKGMKVRDARNKIIEILKEQGLVIKQENIVHRTPMSERSGAEVEFIQMPEFYIKQVEFKEEIKKIAKKIKFYPKESRKILFDWIDSLKVDWPVSRRRFYATPIPLWKFGNKIAVSDGKDYSEPWKESPKENFDVYENSRKIGKVKDFKDVKWKGEERVFDTWMDSSISELVLLKYKEDDAFFKKTYPASLRPQGKEIVRTWLYYTLLRGYLETKKPCFKDVWIHQHIVDAKGHKMSKSKGNMINSQELLKKYGGEAIRLWSAVEGDLSKQDLKCSEEKINAELKTINKILNVSKFVMLFDKPKKKPKLTKLDELFINQVDFLTSFCEKLYEEYDFYHPSQSLRRFLWDVFASNYIELIKARAYNEERKFTKEESDSAKFTLHHLLERILYLFYPIIPQVTSVIAKEKGIDLTKETWPTVNKKIKNEEALAEKLMNFNSHIWKIKKEKGISLRDKIEGIKIPKELKNFEKDLRAAHSLT